MSRLETPPFYIEHQFPPPVHPLSPPDTVSELGAPVMPTSVSGFNSVAEFGHRVSQQQTESPAAKFRRVSTLAYHKSGLHEPEERLAPRLSKSLVVILPPESLSLGHGHLGHTLSSGPRNRLSHGILMPLCSTVSILHIGTHTAFNMPLDVRSTHSYCEGVQLPEHSWYMPLPPYLGKWDFYDTSNLR
jgi:hypothetical protein